MGESGFPLTHTRPPVVLPPDTPEEAPAAAMPAVLPPPSPCKEVVFYEPKECSPGLQLYWAACARSLPDMAEALAHGAAVNWVNMDDEKQTPLIMAVQGVSRGLRGCLDISQVTLRLI